MKKVSKNTAGTWKGTAMDNDKLWKKVLKKKSRSKKFWIEHFSRVTNLEILAVNEAK